jgi:hypothetical protein
MRSDPSSSCEYVYDIVGTYQRSVHAKSQSVIHVCSLQRSYISTWCVVRVKIEKIGTRKNRFRRRAIVE